MKFGIQFLEVQERGIRNGFKNPVSRSFRKRN